MNTKEEFKVDFDDMLSVVQSLQREIAEFELDEDDFEDQYEEWLDDIFGPVVIGQLEFDASHVLRELDPIAYSYGLSDYVDSLERSEYMREATDKNGELFTSVLTELQTEFDDMCNALSDYDVEHDTELEDEFEDLIDDIQFIIDDIECELM